MEYLSETFTHRRASSPCGDKSGRYPAHSQDRVLEAVPQQREAWGCALGLRNGLVKRKGTAGRDQLMFGVDQWARD